MSLELREEDHVLWATIERPDALNAIDYETMEALEGVIDRLEDERQWRAFVLGGGGEKCFVSGGDLEKFAELTTYGEAEEMATRMKAILDRLERLDCWTVAHINGDAYGGGCETLLAFDFRMAAEGVRFGFTQAKFHVTPGWGGLTRLVEAVGRRRALRWLGEAAIVNVEEALAAGLIDRVIPRLGLEEAVRSLVGRLVEQDRQLIAALKRGALAARELPRSEAIAAELDAFCELWASEEHQERVEAFLNRKG